MPLGKDRPAVFQAKFQTSKGDFIIEARREWAPRGVDRFFNLVVRAGFFDELVSFGSAPGSMRSSGCGRREHRQSLEKRTDRRRCVRQSNTRGFVSYAMTGSDARTTQLFLLADNSAWIGEGFAPIGPRDVGMEIVDHFTPDMAKRRR